MPNDYATTAGMRLYYDDAGTADPTTQLAGIKSFPQMPKSVADEFETTRVDQMDGTEHDWFKQFAPEHVDPGSLQIKLGMNETQLETLYTLVRVTKSWKILLSSGGKLVGDGYIKEVGPEAEEKGETIVAVTIRFTGKTSFTKAAA